MSEMSYGARKDDSAGSESALKVASSNPRAVTALFLLADVCAAVATLWLASKLSQIGLILPARETLSSFGAFEAAVVSALLLAVFSYGGLYGRGVCEVQEVRRVVMGCLLLSPIAAVLSAPMGLRPTDLAFDVFWFALIFLGASVAILGARMALRSIRWVRRGLTTYFVLVGSGLSKQEFTRRFGQWSARPVRLLRAAPAAAFVDCAPDALEARIATIASTAGIERDRLRFLLAPDAEERDIAWRLEQSLETIGQPFAAALPHAAMARRGAALSRAVGAELPLAEIEPAPASVLGRAAKAVFDISAAVVLTILLAPLLLAISALLAFEKGGVFYRQIRVGRGGRRFNCLKFRSMRPDAEERLQEILDRDPAAREEWRLNQKLSNDPRITRVGAFLRATSLDELPQLLNVLRGEMSLVGPRPIVAPEVDGYPCDRAYYHSPEFEDYKRWPPGITGLWQVSGRARTAHSERVRLDQWYARNWSFWLDVVILFRTVRAVLGRTGS